MLHNLISHIETQNEMSSRTSTLVSSVGSLIQLAITHGADITLKNEAGKSAFDLCSDPNSKEAFKLKVKLLLFYFIKFFSEFSSVHIKNSASKKSRFEKHQTMQFQQLR